MSFRFNHSADSSDPTNYELSDGQSLDISAGDSLNLTNPDDIAELVPQGHDVLVLTKDGSSYLLKNFLLVENSDLKLPDGTNITADSFHGLEGSTSEGEGRSDLNAISFETDETSGSLAIQSVTLLSIISALSQNTSAFDKFELNQDGSENPDLLDHFKTVTLTSLSENGAVNEHEQIAELAAQQEQAQLFDSQGSDDTEQEDAQSKAGSESDADNSRSASIDVTDSIDANHFLDVARLRVNATVVNSDGELVNSETVVDEDTGKVAVIVSIDEEGAGQQVEVTVVVTDPSEGDKIIDRSELTVVLPDPFNDENLSLSLSGSDVIENETGALVGSLEALGSEDDIEGPFTYSILSDQSGLFEIDGSNLKLKGDTAIDYETAPENYNLTIRIVNEEGTQIDRTLTLHPADANDAPDIAAVSVSGSEDTSIPFERETFEHAFSDVDQDDTLDSVRIDTLPENGSLTLDGQTLEIGQAISIEQLDSIAFQPNADWNGHTDFQWSGFDGTAWSTQSATVSIDIENINDAPVATFSIGAQTANEDAAFTFSIPEGLFSDIDAGDSLTLSADTPSWLTFDPETGEITGVPSYQNVGEHRIEITATDSSGATSTTSFTLDIENVNDRPTFTQIQDVSISEYDSVNIDAGASFSDEDSSFGDTLSYSATLADGSDLPEWLSIDETTGNISGLPPQGENTDLDIRVTATDDAGENASNTFALHVENQNDAPELTSAILDQSTDEDNEFTFNITSNFSDSDLADDLTYTATLPDGSDLPDWLNFDSQTGLFSGTPANEDVGMLTIQVTASDGEKSANDFFAIMVDNTNDKPTATALVDQTVDEDSSFSLDVSDAFSDIDVGDVLSYSATQLNGSELPDWLEFDEATGQFSGTPENGDVGDLSILVVASDGSENANSIFTIEVENTNDGPVATFIPEQTAIEDAPFLFDVSDAFSDVDTDDTLSYSATLENGDPLPDWLTLDPATGELSGTPENANVGSLLLTVSASDGQSSASTNLELTIENTNDGPIVSAGIEDLTTAEDSAFSLDVSSNFGDPDFFDTLEFSATLENGDPLPDWLSFDPFTATFSGTPENADVGNLSVSVVATDGEANIADVFTIEVQNTNDGPVATSDFTPVETDEDSAFSFDAAAHFNDVDADDALTYSATLADGSELPDWISIDPVTGELSGIPENGDVGTIPVKVTATDESGSSASGTFKLSVENTNDGPVASAIADQEASEDSSFSLDTSNNFSDADLGDELSYAATLENGDPLPSWLSIDSETGELSGTPRNGDVGSIAVTISASDGESSAQNTFSLEIENTNDGPTVNPSIQNISTPEDAAFSLDVSANFSDVDADDTLSYSATLENGDPLPSWLSIEPTTGELSGTPENGDVGSLSVTVTATDESGATADDTFSIQVENTNDGPIASAIIEQTTDEDSTFSLDASTRFSDEDLGDSLSYTATLENGDPLPSWLSINSETGELSGTPRNGDVGELSVTVSASDGESAAQSTFSLQVENTNDGPTATEITNQTVEEDSTFSLDVSGNFSDIDAGDTLSYSATLENGDPLPDWLSLNESTGKLSGTPANGDIGSLSVTVTATDNAGSPISETFGIQVENTNDGPVASAIADQSAYEDSEFTLDASASFSDEDLGDSLTYSATLENGDSLPNWLSFDSSTGKLSGTPENGDVGSLSVTVSATDESGTTASDTFGIQVENTNDRPTATAISDTAATEDSSFSLDISNSFTDQDLGDSLTYSATLQDGSPLPDWLSFDSENGTFNGTPTNADVDNVQVTVSASDGSLSVSESFAIEIQNTNDGPTLVANIADSNATEDSSFSLDVSNNFADIDADDTLSYSATLENGDPLPSWISIDSETGVLSGTPENGDVGNISVTVTATDEAGIEAVDTFGIQVENTNDGPTASTIAEQTADEDSSFSLDASTSFHDVDAGDSLSYSATLENGDPLPSWLSIDSESGELSGTPHNADVGDIAISVTATDGEVNATSSFEISVQNTNDGPIATTITPQSVNEDSSFHLDVSNNFSDIDSGDTLAFEAKLENGDPLPNWLSFDEDTGVFSGTPENGDIGEISITVTASDGEEIADSTFSIQIDNTNDGPTATAIADQTIDEDAAFSLDASTHFADVDAGDTLSYSATLENGDPLPDWLAIDSETGELSGTPENADVGNLSVTVTATDESGATASDIFGIQVDNTNDGPTATAIADQTTDEDAAFSLDTSTNFADADAGDSLSYSATLENGDPLPNWLAINSETGELSGTPENADVGNLSVTVTATDESGSTASDTFGIQIDNTNDGPTATAIADQTTDEDAAFSLDASTHFADVDAGDTLSYSATLENGEPLPGWLAIDSETGELSGTPENADVGNLSVTVTATDESGSAASDTFGIQIDNTNDGPTATAIVDQTTDEDAAFSLDASTHFADVDAGDSLSYSATLENGDPLPDWLAIDSETGELSGTPENADVGELAITVTATDESGSAATDTFGIQIDNTNDGPTATAIADQTINEDATFSLDASTHFADVDAGDTLSYSATLENGEPLPDWLAIDSETGELSGTPENADVGSLSVTVTATDESGSSASDTFGIQIDNTNDGPTATAIADQTIDEDAAFSLDASTHFADVDAGDTLSYSATLENGDPLPDWLAIDSETGELSGTPENSDVGSLSVTVTATDESGSAASDTFGIQIDNTNDGPTATAIDDQTIDEDAAFSLDASTHFADVDAGDTLSYSATLENGEPLPDWLAIDSETGELSGTPENADVGSLSVTVTATDESGSSASDSFGIQVENTNDGPTTVGQSGLKASYFHLDSNPSQLSDIDFESAADQVETVSEVDFNAGRGAVHEGGPSDNVAIKYEGNVNIDESGDWNFKVTGDDGYRLFVDGEEVLARDGLHSSQSATGSLELSEGSHSIELLYFERGGISNLTLEWQGPSDSEFSVIDGDSFSNDLPSQATEDAAFSLDASAHFADVDAGDTLSYSATLENGDPLPDWLAIDSETGQLSGTPENADVGSLSVTVTATDESGSAASDTFGIQIENTNDGPTATAIADQTIDEDAAFSLDASTHFADVDAGDTLSYSATLENGDPLPDWLAIDSETGELSGTPENADVGNLSVTVTATDESGSAASDTFGIQVENTNDGPTTVGQSGLKASYFHLDSNPSQLSDIDFESAADQVETVSEVDFNAGRGAVHEGGPSDNVAIKYEGNVNIDESGDWNFKVTGDDGYRLFVDGEEVLARDGLHSSQSATGSLELSEGSHSIELLYFERGGISNLTLEWQGPSDSEFSVIDGDSFSNDLPSQATEDAAFSLDASTHFADVDAGDTLSYSATLENGEPLPDWLAIDSETGELSGTPENADVGNLSVTVTATDESGSSASDTFGIQIDNTNDGPTATAIADQTIDEDAAFSLDASTHFADVDAGDSLSYSATLENGDPLPDWLAIDSETGELSGTPENADVGNLSVTVTATDESGSAASDTFGIQIDNTNDGPTATADTAAVTEGNTIEIDVLANDSDIDVGDSLTITEATVDGAKGTVSIVDNKLVYDPADGFPDLALDDSENVEITYTVSDGNGGTTTSTATVTVTGDDSLIHLTNSNNNYTGTENDNEIHGFNGSDTIDGGAGDDTLVGGDGNDELYGGAGDDTFLYSKGDDADDFHGGEGNDTVKATEDDTNITIDSNFDATNSVENISADGHDGVTVTGDYSNQTLDFSETNLDGIESISGGSGNDTVIGSDGDDTILASDGNDELYGGAGDDTFLYSKGDDSDDFHGGEGNDTVKATEDDTNITIDSNFDATNSVENISADGHDGVTVTGDYSNQTLDFSETNLDGIESISGGSGNDTVIGSDGDDTILASDGNDELYGGAGDDTFLYSKGDDADDFHGGEGNDTVKATEDDTNITIDSNFDATNSVENITADGHDGVTVTGDYSNQTLDFSETNLDGIESISGGSGNDTVIGSDGDDTILASDGNDELYGGAGDDTFLYSKGDDADDFHGGEGNDTVKATEDDTNITIDSNFDATNSVENISADGHDGVTVTGDYSNQTLDFSETNLDGIESISGGSGNDTVIGSDGDDTILASDGNDELYGGAGDDTFLYSKGDDSDDFHGGEGNDTVKATGDDTNITIDSNFDATNSVENISADGHDGVTVTGDYSNQTLDFSETNLDGIESISGGSGNDTVIGSDGDDTILASDGNDELYGGAGDDTFLYSKGDDSDDFHGGEGNDTVKATEDDTNITIDSNFDATNSVENISADGHDGVTVTGDYSNQTLDFSETNLDGIESISGGSGNDTVIGSDGDDTILASDGNDELYGGAGDDTFLYSKGDDADDFHGGEGNDTVKATEDDTNITIDSNFDATNSVENISADGHDGVTVTGDYSNQTLDFSETNLDGIESISGGSGNDTVIGSDGDDTILASDGNDELYGGAGDDTFLYSKGDDSDDFHGGEGNDTIKATEDDTNITIDSNFDATNSVENISADGHDGVTVTGDYSNQTLDFSETNLDGIESISGGSGNDTVIGSDGDDTLLGGDGTDTLKLEGNRSEYRVTDNGDGTFTVEDLVSDRGGIDTVSEFENFKFADATFNQSTVLNDNPELDSEIADQSISEDAAFSLETSSNFSDYDGDTLTYSATLENGDPLPDWLAIDSETGELSGTPENSDVGSISVTVTATDTAGESASDTFGIQVDNTNDGPTATAIADQTTDEDAAFSLDASAHFADADVGDSLFYSATLENSDPLPDWLAIDSETGELSGTPENADVGNLSVTVTATDESGAAASDTFGIQVDNTNDGPTATAIADQTTDEDAAFSLDASAHFADADVGDSLSYSATLENGDPLPDWLAIDSETGELSGTPENGAVGSISVTVTATDESGSSASDTFGIQIDNTNDGPTATASIREALFNEDFQDEVDGDTADSSGNWSTETSAENATHGVDHGAYEFSQSTASGSENEVVLQTEPIDISSHDNLSLSFDIKSSGSMDSSGSNEDHFQVVAIVDGERYEIHQETGHANGHSNQTFTVSLDSIPDGNELVIAFESKVTGSDEIYTLDNITLNGDSVGVANQTVNEDSAFSIDTSAAFSDVDIDDTLTYSATLEDGDPLPDWLAIDSDTGELSGTPENGDVGSISVTVTATDAAGSAASDTFGIQVDNTNDGPTATAIADQTTDEDAAFSLDASAAFADVDAGDSLSYSATLENGDPLPDWLAIDSETGELSGTPENTDVGNLSVTVTATDESGSAASDTFGIQVENTNDGPTVTGGSTQTLWSEDFSDESDGATAGNDEAWTTDDSAAKANAIHSVKNGAYEFSDSTDTANANDQFTVFETEAIDISGHDNLILNFDLKGVGDHDGLNATGSWSDFLNVVATVDGVRHVIQEVDGSPSHGEGTFATLSIDDIPEGDSLVLSFEAKTTVSGEVYTVDNIILNDEPVSLIDQTISEDSLFTLDVSQNFEDVDVGDTLTYSATLADGEPLPDWLTIDSATGVLSGTPENVDVGDIAVKVTASDGEASASDTFTVSVENTNDGPTVSSEIENQSINEEAAYSLDTSSHFQDVDDGDVLTYSATLENGDPLPDWLNIDSNTGLLSGTPDNGEDGAISVKVAASDGENTISDTFTLTVDDTSIDLIGQWKLDESTGTTAEDSAGTNDGIYKNGVAIEENGLLETGTAASFDGVNDYVEIAPSSDFQIDDGTFVMAFRTDSVSGKQTLFSRDSSGYDGGGHLDAYVESDGTLTVRFQSASTTYYVSSEAGAIDAGSNHQIAFSFGANGMELSLDGNIVDTNNYTGGIGGNNEPITIGASQQTSGDGVANSLANFFNGTIDNLEIYDGQLPEAAIDTLYSDLSINSAPDVDTPIADQSVDETEAFSLDVSSNFSDSDLGDTLSFSATLENGDPLPDWLTIDTNTGELSGTPADGEDGALNVSVTASDGQATATDTFTLTVNDSIYNPPSLVGQWKLDESTGTNADDTVGNNDGTYINSVSLGEDGVLASGTSASFDGVDDYIEISPTSDFQLTNGTFAISFNPDEISGQQTLFSRDSRNFDDGGHIDAYIESDGTLTVRIQSDSQSYYISSEPGAVEAGQNHQMAISFGDNGLELFLNGASVATNAYTGGIENNNEPITIGASQQTSGDGVANSLANFFNGTIDNLEIYDGQLNESSAQTLYNQIEDADETYTGNWENETITTGSGDDIITTGGGDDTIDAGDGDNIITAQYAGHDNITTGSGNDTIITGGGNDTIDAGDGDNVVIGGAGNETITTGSGNDTISAGWGTDDVTTGAGDDQVTTETIYSSTEFHFGDGEDTLIINADNQGLDFTSLDNSHITDLESIDLTLSDNTTLRLSAEDVLDMTDGENRLFVTGDSDDTVEIDSSYANQGVESVEGADYTHYYDVLSDTHLYISSDITDTPTF